MNILRKTGEALGFTKGPEAKPVVDSKEVAGIRDNAGRSALYLSQKAEFDALFGDKSKMQVVESLTNKRRAKGEDYGTYGDIMVGDGVTVDGKKCLVAYNISDKYPRPRGPNRNAKTYFIIKVEVQD
ncbi:hypothetical protein M0P48_01150 [Candidatus Gracilibacteria bacterium]|nr:hypothetical protein [Candidatus Gracilibacteria bacterium]